MPNSKININCSATYQSEKSSPKNKIFIFQYTINIRNNTNQYIHLIARHWLITDGNAQIREVYGDGVVGLQPVIHPGKLFSYTSNVVLATAVGVMEGKYQMRRSDGSVFDVPIQKFSLIQPNALH